MCLILQNPLISSRIKKALIKRANKKGNVVVYKVVGKYDATDNVYSIYRQHLYKRGKYIHSNRRNQKITFKENTCKEVNRGIHVFLSRKAANSEIGYINDRFVIKLIANIKDLVAVGKFDNKDNAVFTKIYFPSIN